MSRNKPLIDPESAHELVSVINKVASSFAVATLSLQEVLVIHRLLERATDTLLREHEKSLDELYTALMKKWGWIGEDGEEQDDEDDDGSGGDPH